MSRQRIVATCRCAIFGKHRHQVSAEAHILRWAVGIAARANYIPVTARRECYKHYHYAYYREFHNQNLILIRTFELLIPENRIAPDVYIIANIVRGNCKIGFSQNRKLQAKANYNCNNAI